MTLRGKKTGPNTYEGSTSVNGVTNQSKTPSAPIGQRRYQPADRSADARAPTVPDWNQMDCRQSVGGRAPSYLYLFSYGDDRRLLS
jgi:hypothetical protein